MNALPRVKICGVSDPETALVAVEAGADFIGLVFYSGSHRFVTRERAREIAATVHASSRGATQPRVVGLFVNKPVNEVLAMQEEVGLDIVQLSGSESTDDMRRLRSAGVPFIATIRAGSGDDEEVRRRFLEVTANEPFAAILDTHVPGMWGGSGVVGDWDFARELAGAYPLFLAGGLDPMNVNAAIEAVRPFAVDVSSGVETNKVKDHRKIRAFIAAARNGRQAGQ